MTTGQFSAFLSFYGQRFEEILMSYRDELIEKKQVQSFKCDGCPTILVDKEFKSNFFTVYGNINVGVNGKLISGNIHEGMVNKISIFCRPCMFDFMNKHEPEVTQR